VPPPRERAGMWLMRLLQLDKNERVVDQGANGVVRTLSVESTALRRSSQVEPTLRLLRNLTCRQPVRSAKKPQRLEESAQKFRHIYGLSELCCLASRGTFANTRNAIWRRISIGKS
jgi:hypothetical protein